MKVGDTFDVVITVRGRVVIEPADLDPPFTQAALKELIAEDPESWLVKMRTTVALKKVKAGAKGGRKR
jgi:hypothetical protein